MNARMLMASLLLFFGFQIMGQEVFDQGYIVSAKGDTTYCDIMRQEPALMSKACKWKDAQGVVNISFPRELKEFRFTNSSKYQSQTIDSTLVFVEHIFDGKIDFYYLQSKEKARYFAQNLTEKLREITYEPVYNIKNGHKYLSRKKNYVGLLKYYLKDAPSLFNYIENMSEPNHVNLIRLAKDYESLTSSFVDYEVYEGENIGTKYEIELLMGLMSYANIDGLEFLPGVYARLWRPRTSNLVRLKFGLFRPSIEVNGVVDNFYSIPLMIERVIPIQKLEGRISLGFNTIINSLFVDHSIITGISLGYPVTDRVSLTATTEFQFATENLVQVKDYQSTAILVGGNYRF